MHRKLIGLCASLVALVAFAVVPAVSSAHRAVDTVNGVETTVAVGSKITAYSEEAAVLKSSGLEVKCNENILTGSVTKNPGGLGGVFEGTIEDAWFQGSEAETKCSSNLGATRITLNLTNGALEPKTHWCTKTIAETDKFVTEPHNCGGAGGSFTFEVDAPGLSCGFKREANITGTFKTGSDVGGVVTPATLTAGVSPEAEIEFVTDQTPHHSIFCPAKGTLSNFKFNLYTDKGVTSNAYSQKVDTENPIWITEQ